MEKSKRQMEDQEPEASSSKNSKVKMASSAFDRKQDATTIFFNWENNDSCDYHPESGVFGSKKTLFYISLKCATDSDDFEDEDEDSDYTQEEDFDVYFKLAESSIKKKVFIESLSISANGSEKSVFHNKGIFSCFYLKNSQFDTFFPITVITTTTPLKTTSVTFNPESDYFEGFGTISVEITFRELEDGWNSQNSMAPINHAEVLCRQLANITSTSPTDVTLKTMSDGKMFPAHKLILKMRSPVFAAMFSGDFVENKAEKPVEIFEISGPVMEAMLAYMYCKPFENWKMMAGELATAADMV